MQITAAATAARRRRGARTQDERSSQMRERILDATLDCLVELGYVGTTFSTIAKKAGVSRGALQHHYPEKNYVIAGALEWLLLRDEEQALSPALQMPRGARRVAHVLDRMWAMTIAPPLHALLDVRIAARTDADLRAMLLPLEHRARELHYKLVGDAMGAEVARAPGFAQRVDAALATMRGLSAQLAYGWDRGEIEAVWAVARDDAVAGFQRKT